MPQPTPWGVIVRTGSAPAIWGTTYAVTSELLPEGRPLFAAFVRALPAGLLLLTLAPVKRPSIAWPKLVVLAMLNFVLFFPLLFIGAERLPGGVASTVTSFQPLYVALLSVGLLNKRITARTLLAGACGIAGVALLVLRSDAQLDGWGIIAVVCSSCCTGAGIVMTKRWGVAMPPLTLAGWQLTLGGLMLFPTALIVEGLPSDVDGGAIAGLIYLATVGGAMAYLLWFTGIQRLAPTQVSFLTLLTPVVATTIGWLVLDQSLTPLQCVGAVLAVSAAAVTQLPAKQARSVDRPLVDAAP